MSPLLSSQGSLDIGFDGVRNSSGWPTFDGNTLLVNKEFAVVPVELSGENGAQIGIQLIVHRTAIGCLESTAVGSAGIAHGVVNRALAEKREGGILGKCVFFNIRVGARLLEGKLVAGDADDSEALRLIFDVHLRELFIINGSQAS